MLKIYTKTGDKGETSLFGGKRVSKADVRVEAYGTVDELNAAIGVAIALIKNQELRIKNKERQKKTLQMTLGLIQNDLLDIGSYLASPDTPTNYKLQPTNFVKRIEAFEKAIDAMTEKLPPLTQFILPGGTLLASQLHVCRTICRRVERRIVALTQQEEVALEIKQYFNRLSDYFFTLARYVNFLENQDDIVWAKQRESLE